MERVNKRYLRAALGLKGLTMADLAQSVGINPATLYRKINGESRFYLNEARTICRVLGVRNLELLFLAPEVAKTKQRKAST